MGCQATAASHCAWIPRGSPVPCGAPKHLHLGAVLGTSLPDGFCQESVTEPTALRPNPVTDFTPHFHTHFRAPSVEHLYTRPLWTTPGCGEETALLLNGVWPCSVATRRVKETAFPWNISLLCVAASRKVKHIMRGVSWRLVLKQAVLP
jgi:hypothetical protein